ncbi:MAG: MotA/TolQ/ExbB proton channel family protein [Desulfamplus sp.]|nr:MotA/TolQ/ExbB proton channel family protein [Desulfamplus sp.]MBF0411581.1 MotA/TolQ/ExbB proton channel family protein [Desulfamplus sp.]
MSRLRNGDLIKILQWKKMDIEEKIGVNGGKYTDVNLTLTFFLGVFFFLIFYAPQFYYKEISNFIPFILDISSILNIGKMSELFLQRGITPFFIVFFSCWSISIMFIKWRKIIFQQKALFLMVVPQTADFELTRDTAKDILSRMYGLVDDPKHFVLLNRIERALANLKNIGLIADVSEVLRAQAQNDEDQMESSYALIRGFVWAIPVLGFIGTVLGLSQAIGSFGTVLIKNEGIEYLKTSLQEITSGLAVAFDTTLIALVAALCIQLLMIALKKREESFLDECNNYCHANIISRLRLSSP